MFPKMRCPWLILFALLCAAPVWADSITLKTGEVMTGTIKSETDTDVTIDVNVSSSIVDERDIQKSDIASISREQPDEIEYKQLIAVQPNPELSYSSVQYSDIISSLQAFETKYPGSTYLPEIKKLEATFENEKKRVDAGQVRFLGKWLNKEEAAKQGNEIAGVEMYDSMQQQASGGDLIGSLQTFSQIEQTYGGTRAYPAAVTLALQVIPSFAQQLVGVMQRVKADQAQLKTTLAATPSRSDPRSRRRSKPRSSTMPMSSPPRCAAGSSGCRFWRAVS